MRVVEQLIQHFWQRGALTRTEIEYLVSHGFVRAADLPDYLDADEPAEPTPLYEPEPDPDPVGDRSEPPPDPEDVLLGRRVGKKRGGKKKPKPTGHNLAPLEALLGAHLADREPYEALVELGNRIRPCKDWVAAASAVASLTPLQLDPHLVQVLNHRPPALGELWFWFSVESLIAWTQAPGNAGPVAAGLAGLIRAEVLSEVGRLEQLRKAAGVDGLIELLAARKVFLGSLRVLYRRHFARLKRWLVAPSGPAAAVWPALPWAFVLVYNARTPEPTGYPLSTRAPHVSNVILGMAWEAAWRMESTALLGLIPEQYRSNADLPVQGWNTILGDLMCPLDWRV